MPKIIFRLGVGIFRVVYVDHFVAVGVSDEGRRVTLYRSQVHPTLLVV